jgi:thioredoxin-like negative regulator of GroEL
LQKNTAVVFFVAPWCKHCRALEPSLNKIMGRFSTSRRNGVIARVSEGDIKQINCDNDVDGFPTIRVLKNGEKIKDYEGQRDEKSLNAFLADVFNENLKQPNKVKKPMNVEPKKKNNVEPKKKGKTDTKKKNKVGPKKKGKQMGGTKKRGPKKRGPKKRGPKKKGTRKKAQEKRHKKKGIRTR